MHNSPQKIISIEIPGNFSTRSMKKNIIMVTKTFFDDESPLGFVKRPGLIVGRLIGKGMGL